MDAKEYLEQARFLDMRITAKLVQLEELKGLMVKVGGCGRETPAVGDTSSAPVCALGHLPGREHSSLPALATNVHTGTFASRVAPHEGKARGEACLYEKIAGMQEEINRDIDELVDLKREITDVIRQVPRPEYQTLLELRYLCFWNWEKVSRQMGYSLHHVFKLNNSALHELEKIIEKP